MNLDNQRLKEIQLLKKGYARNRDKAESMYDMFRYQHMIDEIEKEETEILQRNDVIICPYSLILSYWGKLKSVKKV